MALRAEITQISSVTGTQTFGQVSISIYDASTNLPTNGDNCTVFWNQNINGAISDESAVISGLSTPIYTGLIFDSASDGFFTHFTITGLEPGTGIPPDPAADDLRIVNIITTPESAIGAADGTITINATSSFPAINYSLDNSTFQSSNIFTGQLSGSGTAYVNDTNGGDISSPYTIELLGNILATDPTVDLGNGNLSRWNAAFNPIWFKYQRQDFEVTSITLDTDTGNILVAINADMTNVKVKSVITTLYGDINSAGDFVYISTSKYGGSYEVLSKTAGTLVLNTPHTVDDTTGFININSLRQSYYIQTVITFVNQLTGKFATITSNNYPFPDGHCNVDLSSFLKSLLVVKDYSSYNLLNYRDLQLSASYTISYAEVWTGNTPVFASITRPYYVLFIARQLQQLGGGNMQEYVPYINGFQPAKWLTDFTRPVYNHLFPFDLGFIFSEYMVGLSPYYIVLLYDINMTLLSDQSVGDSFLLNEDGSFILQQDGGKFIIAEQSLVNYPIVEYVGLNRLLINFTPPSLCWYFSVQLKYDTGGAPAIFNVALTEATSPDFIDGNGQLKINGNDVLDIYSSGSKSFTTAAGSAYSFQAIAPGTSAAANPKIRLTITRTIGAGSTTVIYDNQIPAIAGANMVKTGIAQIDATYTVQITTADTTTPVTLINIADTTPVTVQTYPLTVPQICRIDQNTTDRQVYLRWIGLLGTWEYYTFSYNQTKILEVFNTVTIKNFIVNWETTDTIIDVISKNANEKMTVYGENITFDDILAVRGLKTSPKSQIFIGPVVSGYNWLTINSGDATYTEIETRINAYSLAITFSLPEINLQFQ